MPLRDLSNPVEGWESLGSWWLRELSEDLAYEEEIGPLLLDLLEPRSDWLYLDLGCGEGRIMRTVAARGASVIGCDLNSPLLHQAIRFGPVVRARLPSLSWLRPATFDAVFVGLVLEHLPDETAFFQEAAGVVRAGGVMVVVINHPIWTAPESSPMDAAGETLWRPGAYFGRGFSDEPAGDERVRFFHRTLADLLNAASAAGWDLQRLEERGISAKQVAMYSDYSGQEHIPRVLGARWRRRES